jgi:hypothetical protein
MLLGPKLAPKSKRDPKKKIPRGNFWGPFRSQIRHKIRWKNHMIFDSYFNGFMLRFGPDSGAICTSKSRSNAKTWKHQNWALVYTRAQFSRVRALTNHQQTNKKRFLNPYTLFNHIFDDFGSILGATWPLNSIKKHIQNQTSKKSGPIFFLRYPSPVPPPLLTPVAASRHRKATMGPHVQTLNARTCKEYKQGKPNKFQRHLATKNICEWRCMMLSYPKSQNNHAKESHKMRNNSKNELQNALGIRFELRWLPRQKMIAHRHPKARVLESVCESKSIKNK